jgi:hypothetical protein
MNTHPVRACDCAKFRTGASAHNDIDRVVTSLFDCYAWYLPERADGIVEGRTGFIRQQNQGFVLTATCTSRHPILPASPQPLAVLT